ncbi:MAG TPA: cyclopropane-fatty-acyl-phospholipid synthase family protein [Candidatus Sulfopaludibacter sp.]|nr:cyclopropane-fatty-acyl-phospholipid synthase family protein [Candidatus Sulfopaludibacter sp.]
MRPELCESGQPARAASSDGPAWNAIFSDGTELHSSTGTPRFTFRISDRNALERLLASDPYSAAMAFVRGEFDVAGDLAAAIRFKGWQPRSGFRRRILGLIARCATLLECAFQSRIQAARNIRFHYDRSNEFYRLFLDPRMVYSCAYFPSPETTLEEAQAAKLDHICRKLDLRHGERFLDVGCGWGALVERAAARFGAEAAGCTLSHAQYAYAAARLDGCARIQECDYHDLTGRFDKIASVGVFEHIGRHRVPEFFRKIADLLAPNGLYLHHSIARSQRSTDDAASLFVRRRIFPGGQLIHLHEMIRAAESAGFEVLDIENLRPHYARTCRLWGQRLEARREEAVRIVGDATFREWRIWLAASSLSFEEGFNSIYQILLGKCGAPRRRMTRQYLYLEPQHA